MAILKVARLGHPVLRQRALPVPIGEIRACIRPIVRPSLTATARSAALTPSSRALRPMSTGREERTSPARVRPSRMKLSIGFLIPDASATAGTGGRFTGWYAQCPS